MRMEDMCSMLQMFLLKTDLHCCVYPKEIISENDSTCPCFFIMSLRLVNVSV